MKRFQGAMVRTRAAATAQRVELVGLLPEQLEAIAVLLPVSSVATFAQAHRTLAAVADRVVSVVVAVRGEHENLRWRACAPPDASLSGRLL